ncbi:PaaI family thioesterase [Halorientalis brevis]|uniref:PaaI family thioesterase n=1 Tax=Halorientalis brevis TaxID=1126241 RepID=A0ABD6CFH7_9EURY|nr:PaaI family thioesterase [Halorientalis brevis]
MANDLPEGAPVMLRMSVERENGYLSWLGVQMQNIQYGKSKLTIPFDEKFTDEEETPPTVHNGIVTTLMEQTGELAIRTTLDDPVNDLVEPLNINVNFLHDAVHDLTGYAEVVEMRETSAIATITVESRTATGNMESIATGQGVFRVEN